MVHSTENQNQNQNKHVSRERERERERLEIKESNHYISPVYIWIETHTHTNWQVFFTMRVIRGLVVKWKVHNGGREFI